MKQDEELELDDEVESEDNEDVECEEEKPAKTKKKSASKKATQKIVSDAFTNAIKKYLDQFAATDSHFSEKYQNPGKSIVECCAYIVGQSIKQQVRGFDDGEVYAMARHYYLEEIPESDLKIAYEPNRVAINQHVELTEEEKEIAKTKALADYQAKELKAIEDAEKKKTESIKKAEEKSKEKLKATGQSDIFDLLGE